MKKTLLLIVSCAAMFLSCSKDDQILPPESKDQKESIGQPVGYVRSIDEIIELALDAPTTYLVVSQTKSSGKSIKEVVSLVSILGNAPQTRSNSGSTEIDSVVNNIYVVNYDNNAGFSIISADNRLPDVLACSDKGNIPQNVNDIESQGVVAFLSALPDYASLEIDKVKTTFMDYNPGDSIIDTPDGLYRLNHRYEYGPWSVTKTLNPIVKTTWSQGYPYNLLTPYCYEHQTQHYTGCVATAVAQIIAFHRKPYSIHSTKLNKDVVMNWSTISSSPTPSSGDNEAVAALMEVIGEKVNMNYTCTGSGAYSSDVFRALNSLGYTCDGFNYIKPSTALKPFNVKTLCANIRLYPVYIDGDDIKRQVGHAWVVDGAQYSERAYMEVWDLYDQNMNYKGIETRTSYSEFNYTTLHCNWGWGGSYDGYYASGVFNPGVSSYTTNNKMITGIKPR